MPLSPMMQQYLKIKNDYPGCILFFRLGDFYEMFFDDARKVSAELEIVLTGKECGMDERAPMCGVPFHSAESYIARLVNKGYRVAICEQMENASETKGIVKRDVVRIISMGTVIESQMLESGENNYLATVVTKNGRTGLCFTDASTGLYHLTVEEGEDAQNKIINQMSIYKPKEILMDNESSKFKKVLAFALDKLLVKPEVLAEGISDRRICENAVDKYVSKETINFLKLREDESAMCAVGVAVVYIEKARNGNIQNDKPVQNFAQVEMYNEDEFLKLDFSARRNLELTQNMQTMDKKHSLLWVLDKTKTPMGKRMLRSWVEKPLVNIKQISMRHNAVDELVSMPILCDQCFSSLSDINDLERPMTRIAYGTANAKELRTLAETIAKLPTLKEHLSNLGQQLLKDANDDIDLLEDIYGLIDRAIVKDPPFSIREGGMIKPGYNVELDELREIMNDGAGIIAGIETDEKEKTGISKLKIGYNRIFGYYIEVTNSFKDKVPDEYIRKQTLANCERYITQELKDLEGKIIGAKEKSIALEGELFAKIRDKINEENLRVQKTAKAVAVTDAICSLARVAMENNYVRPDMTCNGTIEIVNGRHPVVELLLDTPFVPNDTLLDGKSNRVSIITGPNMAGKSTYMRQIAIIVVMAQIGSFVPADSANLCVVDAVFTRVGASDDLASGQSTFMVEMNEVATILKNATANSLIILDEIGRGTSTFDGMSIARAVLEYVADTKKLGSKSLFATHYHELTVLEGMIDGVKNYSIAVKKRGDDITFLRRIVRGGADESFGIEVAKLAGIPNSVVKRAKLILQELESDNPQIVVKSGKSTNVIEEENEDNGQLSMAGGSDQAVLQQLRNIDVNVLTPIEALQTIYELKKGLK